MDQMNEVADLRARVEWLESLMLSMRADIKRLVCDVARLQSNGDALVVKVVPQGCSVEAAAHQ